MSKCSFLTTEGVKIQMHCGYYRAGPEARFCLRAPLTHTVTPDIPEVAEQSFDTVCQGSLGISRPR